MEFLEFGDPTAQSAPQGVANAGLAQILNFDYTEPLKYQVQMAKQEEMRQKQRQEAKQDKEEELMREELTKIRNMEFKGAPEVANSSQQLYSTALAQGFQKYGNKVVTLADGRTMPAAAILQSPTARANYMPQIMADPELAEGAKYFTNLESVARQLQNVNAEYTKLSEAARTAQLSNPDKIEVNTEAFESVPNALKQSYANILQGTLSGKLPDLQATLSVLSNAATFRDETGNVMPLTMQKHYMDDIYAEIAKTVKPTESSRAVESDIYGYKKTETTTKVQEKDARPIFLSGLEQKVLRTASGQLEVLRLIGQDYKTNASPKQREFYDAIIDNYSKMSLNQRREAILSLITNDKGLETRLLEPGLYEKKESKYLEDKALDFAMRRQPSGGGEKPDGSLVLRIAQPLNIKQYTATQGTGLAKSEMKDTGKVFNSYGGLTYNTKTAELKQYNLAANDGAFFFNKDGKAVFLEGNSTPLIKDQAATRNMEGIDFSNTSYERSGVDLVKFIKKGNNYIPVIEGGDQKGGLTYQNASTGEAVAKKDIIVMPALALTTVFGSGNKYSGKGSDNTVPVFKPATPQEIMQMDEKGLNALMMIGYYDSDTAGNITGVPQYGIPLEKYEQNLKRK